MELWQIIIIPLLTAVSSFIPFSFYRFQISRREVARFRRTLDIAADFRRIARDCNSMDESPEYKFAEEQYQSLLRDYEKLNGFGEKK